MQSIILSIGDELVLGQSIDTNSAYLSSQLAGLGIGTRYHQTVADDLPTIVSAIQLAAQNARIVIITGGLGPTDDDLTRQALSDAMGQPLVLDPASVEHIASYFTRLGRTMPDRNKVQALHPAGSQVIPNSCGTAPGIKATLGQATIYVTPGVPREMVAMFNQSILPDLQKTSLAADRGAILTLKLNTFGSGESTVAERLGPLMARDRNPKVGTTVAAGVVSVRIRSEFPTPQQAQQQLDDTAAQVKKILGPIVYGQEEQTLQQGLIKLLLDHKRTVATAESCTGGLLGAMLTDVPGSSAAYRGGFVTYSNDLKTELLGVPADLINQHGAVSQQVALAMAQGALQRSGADLAVSITGIAGPDGGTPDKPVGTVWIGLASRAPLHGATSSATATAYHFLLIGQRDQVRDRAAKCALTLLRFIVTGTPIDQFPWATPAPGSSPAPGSTIASASSTPPSRA